MISRGIYIVTAGVLSVFLDEQVKIDSIVSVSSDTLFGANIPSQQKDGAL